MATLFNRSRACLAYPSAFALMLCSAACAQQRTQSLDSEATYAASTDAGSNSSGALSNTPATVMIVSVNSGKAIDIYNGVNSNGATIQQYDAWSGPMQQWQLLPQSDGSVEIYNPLTSKVVDVSQGSKTDGALVWLWTPTGGTNQHWRANKMADGTYTFTNVNSNKCLDVLGLRTDNGAPVGQWDCNGKANQAYKLVTVTSATPTPTPPSGTGTGTGTTSPTPAATPITNAPIPGNKVGMYYAVWQWEAWTYQNESKQLGLPQYSVESVLRTRVENGTSAASGVNFSAMRDSRIAADGQDFYYQYDPQAGFYCIYHQRTPGSVNYNAAFEGDYGLGQKPDCPMYKSILATHAQQISALGVDFIFVDMTNPAEYSNGSDAIQTRPFEVVTEEWSLLRAQGINTPAVVAWQRLPQAPSMPNDGQDYAVYHVLNVYNDPAHANAIMRDPKSGKKIFLYVGSDNADPSWVNTVESNGGRNDIVAVPMWGPSDTQWCAGYVCLAGAKLDDAPCNQPSTPHSKLGSQSSVTPKYQSPFWASMAFDTVGVHNGLTLRKQFWSALGQDPDWLLIYGWNEQIAQAWSAQQWASQSGRTDVSMGFETDPTINGMGFVDLYGVEYTRDIEPTQQYGTLMYDITKSCIQLYRKGATTCSDPDALCCQGGNFSDNYLYYDGASGPFEIPTNTKPGGTLVKLYECLQGSNKFLSTDSTCGGNPVSQTLGYVSKNRGGYFLRPLYRCVNSDGVLLYSLTGTCSNSRLDAILGYVR